jgi:D-alanine-D-alanine ligase
MERTRLVVLFGGRSAEHEVSCTSAMHVLGAIDRERYDVVPIGITHDGRWLPAADVAELPAGARALPSPDETRADEIDPMPVVMEPGGPPTVVFPLLHGPMGEDGTVQGLLELAGVPYVGAGVLGSAVCMDKGIAKDVLAAHGLAQVRWRTVRDVEAAQPGALEAAALDLGFPIFVKPANLGSSVGIAKASNLDELEAAVAQALRFDEYAVLEEALDHPREIELAVLGNAEPRVSVPGEVVPSHDFYDFDDKYIDGSAGLRIPADLSPEQAAEAQALALAAYKALRVDGFARVDLFLVDGRRFLVNELNTIPGFTPISMYPKLWEASGLAYPQLLDRLVELALARHERRADRAGRQR